MLHNIVDGFQTVRVSLTKHFVCTDLPKTFSLYGMYSVLVLSVLECIPGRWLNSFKFSCTSFAIIPVLHSTSDIIYAVFSRHISCKLFFQVCILLELNGDPYYYYYYYCKVFFFHLFRSIRNRKQHKSENRIYRTILGNGQLDTQLLYFTISLL